MRLVTSVTRPDQFLLPFIRGAADLTPRRPVVKFKGDVRGQNRRRKQREKAERHLAAADAVALVRGCLIATLDRLFEDGELGEVLWQRGENAELRKVGVDVYQRIVVALFPEEFMDRDELAARIAAERARKPPARPVLAEDVSLVPDGGPKRVGVATLKLFAERLKVAQ